MPRKEAMPGWIKNVMPQKETMQAWIKEVWKELTTPPHFIEVPAINNKTMVKTPSDATPRDTRPRSTRKEPDPEPVESLEEEEDDEEEQSGKDIDLLFRMKGFSPKVLEHYPFEVIQAAPHGSVMQLRTSDGTVALKRFAANLKRAQFISKALQHVENNGFTRFARLVPNKRKIPYTLVDDHVYYATPWIAGKTADLSSMAQVAESASALAEFHRASRGFDSSGYTPPAAFGIDKVIQSRAEEFDLFIARARSKKKSDAIDRFVIRHAPMYKKQAEQAAKLLKDPRCRQFLDREQANPGLCHLDITPENLIYATRNQMYLIDFDRMAHGPRMLDLAHLIRRSLQTNGWQRESALIALVQANNVAPLWHAEYRILQSILTFPHSVWHSCHNHYLKRPTPYTLARLEQLFEQEHARQDFLDDFAKNVDRHREN